MLHNANAPPPPPVLEGFEHVKRFWDHGLQLWVARVLPGEFYTSASGEGITTVLGSCVACCMRDPVAGIAGMNHFMLPDCSGEPNWGSGINAATRYGSHAMEQLINSILRVGGQRHRLESKLFGGSAVLNGVSDIGWMNVEFAHNFLINEGFRVLAEDTGGGKGRKVIFLTESGRVRVKLISSVNDVVKREGSYLERLSTAPPRGKVELFS